MAIKDLKNLVNKKYYGLLYFISLCVIAYFLNGMFLAMQNKGYINFTHINQINGAYREIWYILITFCFGVFYGANLVTLKDIKKRLQGILILTASSIVVYIFNYIMTIRPEIFIFGLIVGAVISYRKEDIVGKYKEYPRATFIVSFLVLFSVLLSFINYLLGVIIDESINQSNIYELLKYSMLTISFSWIFYKFSRYEVKNSRIFVVGPRQSGKTVFMCGCYDKADKLKNIIGPPSKDLEEAVRELRKKWIPGTVVPKNYQFKYLHGTLFVNEVEMNMFDIGGEFLELRINQIILYIKNKNNGTDIENVDPYVKGVGDEIYLADKLIFIVDGKRIGGDEDYITNCHTEIIRAVPNKPYYIIVTKSDKFYDFNSGLNDEGYENLKRCTLDELSNTGNLDFLDKGLYIDTLPVFFMESQEKPAVEKGRFVTLGFDKILEVIS